MSADLALDRQAQPRIRRITQACDFCHRRGKRCRPAAEESSTAGNPSCLTCVEYDQTCTWARQPKKRGTKPKGTSSRQHVGAPSVSVAGGLSNSAAFGHVMKPAVKRTSAECSDIASRKIITALLDVYLDSIHPIFPFFCEREIWVGWRDGSFPADNSDYMSLMCMCALSAQHVGIGALFSNDVPTTESASLAQDYLAEAIRLVSLDFAGPALNQIRSFGFLSLLGAQTGNSAMEHKYLGLYHGLCACYNLHDESQWPVNISECEIEVRRRLWWIMYRLEVHTACVHGSLIRSSEAQCNVGYPAGLHHPAFIPGRDGQFEDWFAGWNSTTDLYRVLEHVVVDFRARRRPRPSILGGASISERLSAIQEDILPHFGTASSRSSDSGRNRCGFQASNILCTIHLARMMSISGTSDFQSACQTADDMISSVSNIPIEYIRAAGSPLLQQLAGVGHMLAGVANKHQLSRRDHGHFRLVLASMIGFLSKLAMHSSAAATEERRLSDHLAEADRRAAASTELDTNEAVEDMVLDEHFGWTDHLESLVSEMNDDQNFFSLHLSRNITWPYEPRDEQGDCSPAAPVD